LNNYVRVSGEVKQCVNWAICLHRIKQDTEAVVKYTIHQKAVSKGILTMSVKVKALIHELSVKEAKVQCNLELVLWLPASVCYSNNI